MKLAVSNISLPAYDHAAALAKLKELGVSGLEVAPSRAWKETWTGLKPSEVSAYRRSVEAAGLRVVGLHSLIFDHPELGLFNGAELRRKTLDFFVHLSGVCRDLGGRTMIWGSGRKRNGTEEETARTIALDFLNELATRIEADETVFCFEPLGPGDTDFLNSVESCVQIVEQVDHPAIGIQIDAKALAENDEIKPPVFDMASTRLVHVHANEPGLGILGKTGTVDHRSIGAELRRIGYRGYVSLEHRMLNAYDPISDLATSASAIEAAYF